MKDRNNKQGEPGVEIPSSTSSSLLEAARRLDPAAWRRLARLYGPLVYGWCRRRGLRPPDAEDVVQEVFLTVAARVADFRREPEGGSFRGWLWTITRHKLGDWIRRQKSREQAADADPSAWEDPGGPAGGDEGGEAGSLYRRALDLIRAEFEEPSWQAFWRVAVEGEDPAAVAGDLGMTRNAIYIAKSRILRRLRECLGDD